MRAVLFAVLLVSTRAHADRAAVITVGATLDMRFTAPTWDLAQKKQTPDLNGGALVMLTFEDAPLPLQPHRVIRADLRLVPELLAGALSGDRYAEGFVGAGVRGELHAASEKARVGFYLAARGLVIGKNHDSAVEMVVGEYIMARTNVRFGFEGGAMVRPEDRDRNHQLDAIMRLTASWKL